MEQNKLWERLAGKRLILAGVDNQTHQTFFQRLIGISSQTGIGYRIVDGLETAREGGLVLLFAKPSGEAPGASKSLRERTAQRRGTRNSDKKWDVPFEEPEEYKSWEQPADGWRAAGKAWEETRSLLTQLSMLRELNPESVLLISDYAVYGTLFGGQHARREDELGSICHTKAEDTAAQCMRTAEHFACSLAREQELPLKVARIGRLPEGQELQRLLTDCIRVLLDGENGEIYNVSKAAADTAEQERDGLTRSPLLPMEIAVDTQKAEKIGK